MQARKAKEATSEIHEELQGADESYWTPGGYSIYPWVGRCGPAPHTLTLFKTNVADFPTLFKTELRFLIPCLRHLKSCGYKKLCGFLVV